MLIQNGANVNYAKGILKTAVEHGKLRSSWFFFPLVKFSENKTFSFQGNEKIVGLLVQNRVDVNKADFLGETPLQLAAYKGESNYFS